jgi:CheY-like chemotaxis protein
VQGDGRDTAPSASASGLLPVDPHQDVTGALHDVSNALTVLLGWIAEARSGRSAPEQMDRALAIVEHCARGARDTARRAIGAQVPIDEHEEALDAIVDAAVEALSVEAQRAGITLVVSTRCPMARLPLAADASQVLTNVLLNALGWGPRGSRVLVETAVDGGMASITVRDEGPGVPPADVAAVFAGSSRRQGGAGVGLKHARAVARAAGGELELVSPVPGEGATFRIRWVRAKPPAAPLSAPRAAVLAGTRVLVLEDDVAVATLLESALGARGAQVVVARNVAELAERAGDDHDAALIDLSPIADDVRGALATLHRGSPDAVLVLISGSATGVPEGLDMEHIRWVRKPFEIAEIVAALLDSRIDGVPGSFVPRGG